jgi:AAA15 family ATPase/GTPase
MAIKKIEMENIFVFKDKFTVEFCSGVNILIGGNGSGKTTLLKCLYEMKYYDNKRITLGFSYRVEPLGGRCRIEFEKDTVKNVLYIPEKDILEHAKGLLPFIEKKQSGFNEIYRDVLISAQDIPTKEQTESQKVIGKKIADIIGGHIEWVQSEGTFYTMRTDGTRIPFVTEASGFKKLGFLGLLVASGQLELGSALLWDEPENSLNPELVPALVDILLELQRIGVQIFIATHSYDVARWFELNAADGDKLKYFNFKKTENGAECAATAENYKSLENSVIEAAGDKLYNAVMFKINGEHKNG